MSKSKYLKIIITIGILVYWLILFTGLVRVSVSIWLISALFTFIYYVTYTGFFSTRRNSLKETISDMEKYMERRAEKKFGKSRNKKSVNDSENSKGNETDL